MHDHIFNIRSICHRIKKNKGMPNIYHRINNLMKGAEHTVTPEMIDELKDIVLLGAKDTMRYLEEKKQSIMERQKLLEKRKIVQKTYKR